MSTRMNWRKKISRIAVGTSLAISSASLLGAESHDWPQWNGPKRDNISTETGLLKDWTAGGPKLVWKVEGMGGGYSTVSVADGKIYTMGDHGSIADVMAIDLKGNKLWSTNIGKAGGNTKPGTRSTPTVDGNQVYALGQFGDLVCLDATTGKEVWHKDFRGDSISGSVGGWGYAESPLIEGDNLICTPGGKQGSVAAINKKTGELVWRSKDFTDKAEYSSLVPAEIGGTHQYVVFTGESVAGIAPGGKLLWRAARKGKTAMAPTPVVDGNLVFVTSGYGLGCNCFEVTGSGNDFSAKQLYANKDMIIHHGGVVCINHNIYGATDPGDLVCMSIKDGKVLWKSKCVGKGSIAFADDRLYVRGESSNDIALVEANPEGYKEHGRFKQPDRTPDALAWAHPVIVGGRLYLRDMDILLCYDISAK